MKNVKKILCTILCIALVVVMVPEITKIETADATDLSEYYFSNFMWIDFDESNLTTTMRTSISYPAQITFGNGWKKDNHERSIFGGNTITITAPDGTYIRSIEVTTIGDRVPSINGFEVRNRGVSLPSLDGEKTTAFELPISMSQQNKMQIAYISANGCKISRILVHYNHEHSISYSLGTNTDTIVCSCQNASCNYGGDLQIVLHTSNVGFSEDEYNGADVQFNSAGFSYLYLPNDIRESAAKDKIVYYKLVESNYEKTTTGNSGASGEGKAPKNAGDYKAELTVGAVGGVGGVTASSTFNISPFDTYSISYNTNGGTGGPESVTNASYSDYRTISTVEPERKGFNFLGWAKTSTETNTGRIYAPGTDVANAISSSANSVTLYAIWGHWTYSTDTNLTNLVTAYYKDPNGNAIQRDNNAVQLALVSSSYYADETPVEAYLTVLDTWTEAGLTEPQIKYYEYGSNNALQSMPTAIGKYTAKAEISSEVTIELDFEVYNPEQGTFERPWKVGKTIESDIVAYISGTDLVISGSGEMKDWTLENNTPWLPFAEEITSVDLDPNVTGIGSYAFASCSNMADIELENVKTIGQHAFDSCSSLTSVNLAKAESVGENAFSGVGTSANPCKLVLNTSWNDQDKPTSYDTPWRGGYFKYLNVQYTVTFDLDGGHSKATPSDWVESLSKDYLVGTLIDTIVASWTDSDLEKSDYAFSGWEIIPNAKSLTTDTTIKAKWTPVYLATVDLNGGTVSATPSDWNSDLNSYSKLFIINTSYADIFAEWNGLITKNGYTFKGWTPSAGELTTNTTFTAEWNKNSLSVYSRSNEDKEKEALKKKIESAEISMKSMQTKLNGNTAIKITWTIEGGDLKLTDLDNYEIFRSTKKNSGYGKKPYFTSSKPDYGYYVNNKELKKGKTYYYKVRGFKVIDGTTYYTPWSKKCWRTLK